MINIFMMVWIFIMGLAGFYMFHLHKIEISKDATRENDKIKLSDSNLEEIELKRNPSKALFQKSPVALSSSHDTFHPKSADAMKPQPEQRKPAAEPKANPDSAQNVKPITLIRKPKPEKKKLKDMWTMSVKEQRQYLQDLRANDPDPSTKAADEFISYARESAALPVPPSMWDVPPDQGNRVANSKPGQDVKYKIAGKTVDLPYGFPEESIFILTASYRDPEAASTIARAYAR